jgi:hypothetical protein
MFHATRALAATRNGEDWRVDGSADDGENTRTTFECPEGRGVLVGHDNDHFPGDIRTSELIAFFNRFVRTGYLATPGVEPIFIDRPP